MVWHERRTSAPTGPKLRPAAPGELHPLLRFQQTAGNQAVQRLLAVQRDDTAVAAVTAGATLGAKISGKRPKATNVRNEVGNCGEAGDYLNTGAYVGEANPVYSPKVGKVKIKKKKNGTFRAEVTVTWSRAPESTMELTDFVWPGMTKTEKAAVKRFKASLKPHEVGHFDLQERIIKAQAPKMIWATGATAEEALANLQSEADTGNNAVGAELTVKNDEYDHATGHGKTQSAVGGTDVVLDCS